MRARGLAATLSAAFAVLATCHTAHAQPSAGEVRTATATAQLGGTDGRTYIVTITGRESEYATASSSSEVSLAWKACVRGSTGRVTCSPTTAYRISATASQFSVAADGTTARLALRIAGQPLQLKWTRTANWHTLRVEADHDGVWASNPASSGPATATGTMFGLACRGVGGVEVDVVAQTATPGPLPGSTTAPRIPGALNSASRCLTL